MACRKASATTRSRVWPDTYYGVGVDPFVALELLLTWNAIKCAPPLPDADVDRIVGSIAGKELQRRQTNGG